MEFDIFRLETKRKYLNEPPYGEAKLFYPDGGGITFSSDPEVNVGRKDLEDDTWEQRVIAVTIKHLQGDGYQSFSLTDASERPHSFSRKIWMILASR